MSHFKVRNRKGRKKQILETVLAKTKEGKKRVAYRMFMLYLVSPELTDGHQPMNRTLPQTLQMVDLLLLKSMCETVEKRKEIRGKIEEIYPTPIEWLERL